jgi:hypothetical protein
MAKDLIKSERSNRDDGLIQRFSLFSPRPIYIKKIDDIDNAETDCSLEVFLYVIKRRHEINVNYSLSVDAREFFGELFMKNQIQNENFSKIDTFIGADQFHDPMFTKFT